MFSDLARKWVVSINILVCGIYLGQKFLDVRLSPESLLNHMLVLESENTVGIGKFQPKVALGYGGCHDLFVNATALLDYRELRGTPAHYNEITDKQELLRSFTYFFQHGAAAE